MTHPSQMLAGTRLRAGVGAATVLPDLDFETFSEAGHLYDAEARKWRHPPGTAAGRRKGLGVVGVAKYVTHPSTEILSLAYNLKDGQGAHLWLPGMQPPADLLEHLQRGGLVEAWKAAFEWWVWNYVGTRRHGWPHLAYQQMRCAQAKARAASWPGKLEVAGQVMGLAVQKDARGGALLDKFSVPRNPTQKDPRTRHTPADFPEDARALYEYNVTDTVTEAEASSRCPDLEGEELEFWLLDQKINRRGVAIDTEALHNCAFIVEACLAQYNAEMWALTGGAVEQASQLARLRKWCCGKGFSILDGKGTMDDEAIGAYLTQIKAAGRPEWAPVQRALELRQLVGSASVKKVFAMRNQVSPWGRLHDLYNYWAAHTGRPTGEGPQPTNLPKAGPAVAACKDGCGRHSGTHHASCIWCGRQGLKKVAWGPEAMEDVLQVMQRRDLGLLERAFGDTMLCVSGCLRGMFVASPGCDLVASDFSSIEGVVTACLAGEDWRVEMFATHGKAYELSVSKIAGIPFAEIMRHAGYEDVERPEWWKHRADKTKPHHPLRQTLGKVAELACFAAETKVLTDRGYVAIVDVLLTDLLWDGVEWVTHRGVVPKGPKEVMLLDGVRLTPNHPVSLPDSWQAANRLASNRSMLAQALEHGSASLPSWAKRPEHEREGSRCAAVAAGLHMSSPCPICSKARRQGVTPAQRRQPPRASSFTGRMRTFAPIRSTVAAYSTVLRRVFSAATTPRPSNTQTMAVEGFTCTRSGAPIGGLSLHTCSPWTGGTRRLLSWIAGRLMVGTPPAICASSPGRKTRETSEACPPSLRPVFDIAHAGPRNRFTIKTATGHLIVHNSGFGGWINAWLRFGAGDFMNEEEIKAAILKWREASPAIVEFWGGQERRLGYGRMRVERYGLEGAAVSAIESPGSWFPVMRLDGTDSGVAYGCDTQDDALYCRLPSGRLMTYRRPRLAPGTRSPLSITFERYNTNPQYGAIGWVRIDTYAGKLAENVVQATARDIQRFAMLNLEKAGYPVVLHVYDEDVCDIPQGWGSVEEMEGIMAMMPAWATYKGKPWPIRAAGGWRGRRYRKD